MKVKNFKQFVTEGVRSFYLSDSDILVMVEDRLFVINDIIYLVDVEIAARVGDRDDEEIRHFGSRYFAEDWWLYRITYSMRFKDPAVNSKLIEDINKLNRLSRLGLGDKSNQVAIIDKMFANYPLEEVPSAEANQLESILADQLKNDNYTEILYKSNDTFAETLNNILADEIGDLNGTDDDY